MKQLEAINPIHLEHLPESKLKAEEYLQRFGEYVAEIGEQSGYGDKKNFGKGIQIHISDTRGRKRVTNSNGGSHAIGLCYPKGWASDEIRKIEIDRETADTFQALHIVAHEVSHALCHEKEGHKGLFVKLIFDVFKLGGIPTCTEVSKEFKILISDWLQQNGKYPHVAFTDKGKKQTTRMVKVSCPDIFCEGATEKSVRNGEGTIFRMSSAVILFVGEDNLKCPVCQGEANIQSPVNSKLYQ